MSDSDLAPVGMLRRRISGFGNSVMQPCAPRQEKSSVIGSEEAERRTERENAKATTTTLTFRLASDFQAIGHRLCKLDRSS